MSVRPLSEKAAEILFNRYLLQSFGLGGAQLFAPSSIEEFRTGYDASVVGFSPIREILLQFKAPDYAERNNRFTIRMTPHQHLRLKEYPKRSAFYVAPMLTSLQELNEAQALLKSAEEFLKNFICVEISLLPIDTRSISYSKPETHRNSPEPAFKTSEHGRSHADVESISSAGWERGSTLLTKFRSGTIGRRVDLDGSASGDVGLHSRFPKDRKAVAETTSPAAEFSVHIRVSA